MQIKEPLIKGCYYHIYNRGVNKEDLFIDSSDYLNFLEQYSKTMGVVAETLAYNLLRNHFHFLIYLNEHTEVKRNDNKAMIVLDASKQLGHAFNGYAQRFNRKHDRCGNLFETSFRRKCIEDENDLTSVLYYIHANAEHHGLVKDFRDWQWTSYHSVLSDDPGIVNKEWVLDWFGGEEGFLQFHAINSERDIDRYRIE
jgi:putative transposase